jgi:aminoglycoside phosphotransferase (APT) family kinase protein
MFILEQGQVERLCQTYLGSNATSVEKITGFQADVYLVHVGRLRAVLKCYRQPHQAQREVQALNQLRQYLHGLALPEVIAVHQPGERGEALILTYIHGAPASHELESPIEIDRFADDFVDWLRGLHALSCEKGFQDEAGQWHDSFAAAYQADLAARLLWLNGADASAWISAPLRDKLTALAGQFAQLPQSNRVTSSIIHGDAHAANFLVDPDTHRLCGVIDPGMVRFSHCELDLVQLDTVRPDLKLLGNYLKKSDFDAGIRLRLAFFAVFSDVQQVAQTGVCDEATLLRKSNKVEQLLNAAVLANAA